MIPVRSEGDKRVSSSLLTLLSVMARSVNKSFTETFWVVVPIQSAAAKVFVFTERTLGNTPGAGVVRGVMGRPSACVEAWKSLVLWDSLVMKSSASPGADTELPVTLPLLLLLLVCWLLDIVRSGGASMASLRGEERSERSCADWWVVDLSDTWVDFAGGGGAVCLVEVA